MRIEDFENVRKRLGAKRKNKRYINHRLHVLKYDSRLHSIYPNISAGQFPKKARYRNFRKSGGSIGYWQCMYFEYIHADEIDALSTELHKGE